MMERVAELYRVLQDKQILWLVVYVAAMGLLMEQVYWVVVVFIMMAARVLPRGQLNLGVVFVATRVLLVEQILGEVVCMAAMALHVGQANEVVSYMLTRVLLGKFGAKKDKRLVVVDNMKEVVDRTNLEIEAFNLKNGRPNAPKIHQAGERKKKGKREYMWSAWREEAKKDKLHLTDTHRFRVTKKFLVRYFRDGTPASQQILD